MLTPSLNIDHWAKFVNGLEIEIRSLIMKLHKTQSIGATIYTKNKYTKLFQEILCKAVEFRQVLHVCINLDTSCNSVPNAYHKTNHKLCRDMKNSIHEVGTTSLEWLGFFWHIITNQNAYMPRLYTQKSLECNWLNGFYIQIFLVNFFTRHLFYFACPQSSLKLIKRAYIRKF